MIELVAQEKANKQADVGVIYLFVLTESGAAFSSKLGRGCRRVGTSVLLRVG